MDFIQDPVQIVTRKETSPEGRIQIDFPVAAGMADTAVQLKINNEITSVIYSLISNQINGYLKIGYEREQINASVTYEIKTNERGVLSLAVHAYFFPYPAAHGMTIVKSLTVDINTGKAYQLPELFKKGSPYITVLNGIIERQVRERHVDLLDDIKSIKPDQDYYLADKSIVVYYQLYEMTPYAYGFPMFPISLYEIEELIPDNSLLSNFLINQ